MILSNAPIITVEQASKRAGCSPTWFRKLVRSGRADGYRTYLADGRRLGQWLTTVAEADRVGTELTTRATRNVSRRKSLRGRKPRAAGRRRG